MDRRNLTSSTVRTTGAIVLLTLCALYPLSSQTSAPFSFGEREPLRLRESEPPPELEPAESPSARSSPAVDVGGEQPQAAPGAEDLLPPLGEETPNAQELMVDELSLPDAVSRALLYNPTLQSFSYEVRAREARALQAGLFPNPVLGGEIEQFGGAGPVAGLESAEITLGISQLIPLGGDRRRRREVAELEQELASWNYLTVRLDVVTEVRQSFYEVLASQRRERLAGELLELARRVVTTVSERVEAGKVSPIQRSRAEVLATSTEIDHQRAVRFLAAARSRLSATWGARQPGFRRAGGDFDELGPLPPIETLQSRVQSNPLLARWATERPHRQAVLALEKAVRVPDLELAGGLRRLREIGVDSFVAGVSIPLPLFNRNQGAIREARIRVQQAEADRRSVEVDLRSALAASYERLAAAYTEAVSLREDVLPTSEHVFRATEEGYREGKFDLLSVLDAQRVFFETTTRSIEALASYHQLRAEIERLIGAPLRTNSQTKTQTNTQN